MTGAGPPPEPAGTGEGRLRRRLERERAARREAERVAEHATRRLFDAVEELTDAEFRARVVSETAAGIFSGALSEAATQGAIADSACRALGARRATCYVLDDDQATVVDVHTTETDPRSGAYLHASRGRHVGEIPSWDDLRAGPEPLLERDGPPEVGPGHGGGLVALRLEHASVRRGDRRAVLGVLVLDFPGSPALSPGRRTVALSLAGLASIALANARLHARTLANLAAAEERAARDPLTGLANHRTFQERLTEEVARALRHGRALSLAVFDLDHFKRVNDTHGHQTGDAVLVEAARLLSERARGGDVVARVGGEEFAWLMPETDGLAGWQAAESARQRLAGADLAGVGRMTVSGGVCALDQAQTADRLLALADGALYWAKHHGRNVVVRYTPEVVQVLSAEEQAARLAREQARQSIGILARAVDAKDQSTREHSERVAALCEVLAHALGWPVERIGRLREAALVHDVGKIGVPDAVLLKPGPLTDEEFRLVVPHAALGAEMVSDILDGEQVRWVRSHHERFDGGGYPDGLAGARVPDGARVIALADAWDVMTSHRPYRLPATTGEALAECRRMRGAQFAPEVVDALEAVVRGGGLPAADDHSSPPSYSRR